MQVYLNIFGITTPSYGFLITMGVVLANIAAMFVLKHTGQDFNDFMILEAYGILGAFIGSKLLYLIVCYKSIDWSKITNIMYLNSIMREGFVFYGGLIGGLLFILAAGKLHKIKAGEYVRNFIFLVPVMHAFGRVGCFLAGCCFGIPYDGPGAVIFPEGSYGISGVSLFPVQLVEAVGLLLIAGVILFLQLSKNLEYTLETYLILYTILRLVLENLRYDTARGYYAGISTSQWISMGLLIFAASSCLFRRLISFKR